MIRRSGRSTAELLETIAEAIKNPGEQIYYRDHAQGPAPEATRYHLDTAKRIVYNLCLNITVDYDFKKKVLVLVSNHRGFDDNELTGMG